MFLDCVINLSAQRKPTLEVEVSPNHSSITLQQLEINTSDDSDNLLLVFCLMSTRLMCIFKQRLNVEASTWKLWFHLNLHLINNWKHSSGEPHHTWGHPLTSFLEKPIICLFLSPAVSQRDDSDDWTVTHTVTVCLLWMSGKERKRENLFIHMKMRAESLWPRGSHITALYGWGFVKTTTDLCGKDFTCHYSPQFSVACTLRPLVPFIISSKLKLT